MKKLLTPAIKLLVITLVAGLALGLVYSITKGPIEQQKAQAAFAARQQALDADRFEPLDMEQLKNSDKWDASFSDITAIYEGYTNERFMGWAVEMSVKGYGGPITMTVGINMNGRVMGVKILSHAETAGLGAKITNTEFTEQFYGKVATNTINAVAGAAGNNVDAISGASVSSKAVAQAVTTAGQCFKVFVVEGGE